MTVMGLDEISNELYGLVPGSFVAARGERAAAAKASGDRELAAAITRLARPTVPAWLVNLLVRAEPEQVEEFLRLGPALAEAQAAGAGDELRRLTARRHTLIAALTRRARELAAAAGQPVRDDATRELAGTLQAALADPAAARAVRSGRLTRALRYAGLGPGEVTGTFAVPVRAGRRPTSEPGVARHGGPAGPGAAHSAEPKPEPARGDRERGAQQERAERERREHERAEQERRHAADQARQRQLRAARRDLAKAEEELDATRRRVEARQSAAADARRRLAGPRRRVDELVAQLEQARRATALAEAAAEQADRELAEATAASQEADRRRATALAELARLGEPTDSATS
ncbi:hypothetical protein I6A84_36820 [Frankia sp. CNm7]|uniref:Uncharacterized protein n=1 Tax=Frankia nepalensis TaxID=1836974 RepID=A0A937RIY4_9ACTN|nr:hypothetical protein [Frankia nepalensis]MBL7495742.1 hypothetical protein [Frankia nepalensis]MBL7509016.1 hypothetical protein [Frankia nepalensis]MBL7523473.1 hypothetical protein [Frankia nepalensis]MBL7629815.1 hypothetical protein [Frankia nepalensis]